ncbi:MAG TPA: hypothetical protein VGL09_09200 [Methylomirabilota bacterium]
MSPRTIARLVRGSTAFNTLNVRTVPIHFQRSPGVATGNDRGIEGLEFQVLSAGAVIQRGRTPADGKIDVRLPTPQVTVRLLVAGVTASEYTLSVANTLDPVNGLSGQKQRLRMLGYQIGHDGADGNGVDAVQNFRFERSVLDFQADHGLFTDGTANANTQAQLTTQAGA